MVILCKVALPDREHCRMFELLTRLPSNYTVGVTIDHKGLLRRLIYVDPTGSDSLKYCQ